MFLLLCFACALACERNAFIHRSFAIFAELAKLFIDRLGALRSKLGEKHQGAISWHQLFSQVDEEGSGVITFDELEVAVRSKLKLSSKDFSRASLKALWCVLDADDSDAVQVCLLLIG